MNCRGADYRRDVCYNWVLGVLVIIGFQVTTGGASYCFIVRVQVVTGSAGYPKGQLITGGAGYCKGTGCDWGCMQVILRDRL